MGAKEKFGPPKGTWERVVCVSSRAVGCECSGAAGVAVDALANWWRFHGRAPP